MKQQGFGVPIQKVEFRVEVVGALCTRMRILCTLQSTSLFITTYRCVSEKDEP